MEFVRLLRDPRAATPKLYFWEAREARKKAKQKPASCFLVISYSCLEAMCEDLSGGERGT